MSIRVMSRIWDEGPRKQGPLLVMLALADYANDAGECWPSIKSIAEKARMTERGVQRILRSLEDEKWLFVEIGNGRKGCNMYRINPDRGYTPTECRPDRGYVETPTLDPETPTLGTPEPSRTINEPSFSLEAHENCPFDAFNKIATKAGWPVVQSKSKSRLKLAKARMKECGGFENWVAAMNRGASSSFLSGKATGSTPATFDWLNKAANFTKLMEGNYDDRTRQNPQARRADPALEQALRLAGVSQAQGDPFDGA